MNENEDIETIERNDTPPMIATIPSPTGYTNVNYNHSNSNTIADFVETQVPLNSKNNETKIAND